MLHLKLANEICVDLQNGVDAAMAQRCDKALEDTTNKQNRKFEQFKLKQHRRTNDDRSKSNTVNLSSQNLYDTTCSVLEYSIQLPLAELICI